MARIDQAMTSSAFTRAKGHVTSVCALGQDITLIRQSDKDEMGTGTSEVTLALKAHPVRFAPFDRMVTERISWAEDVEILAYISKSRVTALGYSVKKLKNKFSKMKHNGKTYDIRYADNYNSFGTDFLYVVLGGKK